MNQQLVKDLRTAAERAERLAETSHPLNRSFYRHAAELHRRAANALEAK